MVEIIRADEQAFVHELAGSLVELRPRKIAFFGRTERKQAERRVSEPVFGFGFQAKLRRNATRDELDDVRLPDARFLRCAIKFAERERYVPRFVGASGFSRSRFDGSVSGDGSDVVAQNHASHVQALICKIMHLNRI